MFPPRYVRYRSDVVAGLGWFLTLVLFLGYLIQAKILFLRTWIASTEPFKSHIFVDTLMDISPQKIISLNLLQNSIHMMKHSSKKTKEKAEYIQEKVTNIQCSNYYVSHSNVWPSLHPRYLRKLLNSNSRLRKCITKRNGPNQQRICIW